ncbi:glycosyltransferase [Pseudomonas sp. JS3066]|uniref:glycosyltransferase n=1 Tax=Pseudomonas sp. JS3066 TaxID=3090665 RepID=UPI002E7AB94D|nr:glycosyltransferase [Pseudomonas sp. JS3066]WVK95007.1 glycosyltransferase [Pseudomonas sp. JS3066]
MSGDLPKVSVIIPSYNHIDYVEAAISSVASQDQAGFILELIVIDDGSTDGSVELLRGLQESGVYNFNLVLKSNEGLCKTLNRAVVEHSSGEYVAVIASDDMWAPGKLKQQIKHIKSTPTSELCYSNARTFGRDSIERKASRRLFSGDVRAMLTLYNFVPAGTIFFTRNLYDTVGGFDETGLRLEDWDFLLRASAVTDFCFLDEELLLYRLHDESSIAKMRERGILFQEKMKVLRKNRLILNPVLRFASICLHFSLDSLLRPLIYRLRGNNRVR